MSETNYYSQMPTLDFSETEKARIRPKLIFLDASANAWNETLRQLDETCIMIRDLIKTNPGDSDLVDKLIKVQDQLVQATKNAEEHRLKAKAEYDELQSEDRRRNLICSAVGIQSPCQQDFLKTASAIPIYHRK